MMTDRFETELPLEHLVDVWAQGCTCLPTVVWEPDLWPLARLMFAGKRSATATQHARLHHAAHCPMAAHGWRAQRARSAR